MHPRRQDKEQPIYYAGCLRGTPKHRSETLVPWLLPNLDLQPGKGQVNPGTDTQTLVLQVSVTKKLEKLKWICLFSWSKVFHTRN